MNRTQEKKQLLLYGITLLIAFIIISDFILPSNVITDKVEQITKIKERYYNAGGNYHYTYTITTSKHDFLVSEDFAKSVKENQEIEYTVSLLFQKINKYGLQLSKNGSIHSFRIASGFIFPLIVIITIFVAYKLKKRISTLLFVLQVILIVDVVLLIR